MSDFEKDPSLNAEQVTKNGLKLSEWGWYMLHAEDEDRIEASRERTKRYFEEDMRRIQEQENRKQNP